MVTLIAFLAMSAAVVALVAVVERYAVASQAAAIAGRVVAWPLLALCRVASAVVDMFLRQKGSRKRIAPGWYALWIVVALLPMGGFFAADAWAPALQPVVDPGYLLVIGALFHVLVVAAAYLIVHDDFDVMDGVVDGGGRRIRGARSATRPVAIAISVVLVAAYTIAIAYWLAGLDSVRLVDRGPDTGFAFVDTMLIGLRALPTSFILNLLDRVTGDDTSVVFSGTLVAQVYYFIFKGVGSVLLVGLVTIVIQQAWQLRRIVSEIGESDARHEYLIQRAMLAPPVIKSGILRAAVTRSTVEKQKRLIVAAKEIGIFTLPQTFCHNIETFDSEIQVFGLEQCLEMFRQRARDFDTEQCDATLRKAAHVFRRGKLALEPLKKLLRLMTSILIVKRGAVTIPDAMRGMLVATVRKELDKPRAQDDPALRGFLRDFQTALAGASAPVAPPPTGRVAASLEQPREDWIKRLPVAADPAVPPDSPAPTVH